MQAGKPRGEPQKNAARVAKCNASGLAAPKRLEPQALLAVAVPGTAAELSTTAFRVVHSMLGEDIEFLPAGLSAAESVSFTPAVPVKGMVRR